MTVASTSALPAASWDALDEVTRRALELAWEAVVTGNIGVGAVAVDAAGRIVAASRNRVRDSAAPPGEVAGSTVAHAELNVLARLPFRSQQNFTIVTTLQPCLQCSAAIRMGPVAAVRVVGADVLWDGCADFTVLNAWLARRPPVPVEGPRRDEVGLFATLLARLGPGLVSHVEAALRERGEMALLDVVAEVQASGQLTSLVNGDARSAFVTLWPRLRKLHCG